MTPAAMRTLREMAAQEDELEGEIVCEGREIWIGYTRIGAGTLNQLLRLLAVRDVSEGNGLRRFAINDTGKALVANPFLESALAQAIALGKPFTIIDGKIQDMPA